MDDPACTTQWKQQLKLVASLLNKILIPCLSYFQMSIFSKGWKDCKVQYNNCITFQVIVVAGVFKWCKCICLSDNRSFACRHRLFRRLCSERFSFIGNRRLGKIDLFPKFPVIFSPDLLHSLVLLWITCSVYKSIYTKLCLQCTTCFLLGIIMILSGIIFGSAEKTS